MTDLIVQHPRRGVASRTEQTARGLEQAGVISGVRPVAVAARELPVHRMVGSEGKLILDRDMTGRAQRKLRFRLDESRRSCGMGCVTLRTTAFSIGLMLEWLLPAFGEVAADTELLGWHPEIVRIRTCMRRVAVRTKPVGKWLVLFRQITLGPGSCVASAAELHQRHPQQPGLFRSVRVVAVGAEVAVEWGVLITGFFLLHGLGMARGTRSVLVPARVGGWGSQLVRLVACGTVSHGIVEPCACLLLRFIECFIVVLKVTDDAPVL